MKQNCRLKIINDVLDLTGEVTSGKPTYNYNRDQRYVEVNFGPNLKKVKTYEQAVEVAKSRAYAWNKKINGKRFLDNIFEAVENFIQIKISNKFINGKLKDPDFENSEQAYKNYIENTPGNETIDLYGRMSKAELEEMRISEQALRDQGDYFFQQDNAVTYNFKGAQKILDNMSKIDNWSKQIKDSELLFNKIQKDLGIPKNQLDLIKDSEGNTIKDKVISFISNYSYTVEINTALDFEKNPIITKIENDNYEYSYQDDKDFNKVVRDNFLDASLPYNQLKQQVLNILYNQFENKLSVPTQIYSNLTVPGGTNYTEQEIATPAITPSIKGHAQFTTDKGIGWFRSDEQSDANDTKNKIEAEKEFKRIAEQEGYADTTLLNQINKQSKGSKTRRILELQSDLFQKGRDRKDLITRAGLDTENISITKEEYNNNKTSEKLLDGDDVYGYTKGDYEYFRWGQDDKYFKHSIIGKKSTKQNQFLQFLNKDNNWVTFFVKSIIQDSAKKGYEKVLFPSGNTASKVEGHATLEEFKKQKENRIKELESEKSYIEKEENSWVVRSYKNGFQNSFKDEKSALNLQERNNKYFDNEINQLKQELERVEREGFGALKPIYNFYETVVANVLKKQGYNSRVITDEYGNTWNEVTIDRVRDTSPIYFQNKTETTKKNPIERLNERLISALQSIGVKVEFADSLKNRFSNDPVAAFDSVNKLILIAKNKANVTTLPEEAFHAIVDAFEDHPFIQRLMDLASKTDYKSILGEEYVQLYKDDETKLKKEIIGKWLAGVATNTYEGAERTKSILRQFWDFILSKFGRVSDKYQQEFNTELQNALNQVVESTLKGELPTNYSGYTPKDGVFFQTKSSKKSKDTKDKKQNIQSKLLEQEIYFKRRKAKLEDWLKKNPQDHPARPARILEYDSVVKALAQYEDLGTGAGFVETGEIILNNIDNFLRRLETDSLKTYLSRDMDDDLLYTLNTLDVFSRLPSLEGRANKLRDKFNEYAIEYTMLQVNKFRNVGEELTWEDVLGQNVDINLYRRYFGALADVQDYLGSTIGVLIKRAQNRASTNNQKLASETSEWAKKLSDWGKANGKSYDDVMQLFVQVVDDKAILAKPWSTKFYNDLATHANKKDGWYAANAIKTKEGWVPVDKTKYANPQYAYIMKTPVLKEFYNYYQSSLESFGTKLPRQVNKNMIPNLLKNTLSDIIQSDKSTLSKASELVSKVLNIGNYYEDGLIIHDKFKNDVIPLKYFKNITPDKKNLDLVQALYKFGEFANEYDELSDVLPKTRLIQRVMSTKQYIKSNDPKGAISGSETKIFQLADDYIKMQVLGEMKADEGVKLKVGEIQDNEGKTIGSKTISTSDIIDKFLGYNSLLRIGFNPFNALTNALVGETGNLIEAAGGRYYDVSGLNKATKIFTTQNFSEKSKMNKILEKFNPLQELTEYSHATNVSKNKLTKEKFMDIMYSPQRAGEKFLQSRTMVAMMFKEKMPDGKDMWEAFDDNGELKAEYRKNMTNEQYQEFIDKFSDKVQRVNQMIHGRYSQRDASAAQQWVLMRMILQFKKWIPAAYESRLGKRQYDPRLRDEVEGRYLTGARILRDALKGDLGRLKAGNMTPLELYNMRKNLMEAVLILATYGLYLLMGWGDDEEKKRSASYKFFIDQADRVSGDLLYWYNPAQINRTVKSPISLTTTVSDAVGAITELPFVFGEDAEYKRGERKGENKFVSKTMNLIPLVKPTADFVRLFNKEKYVEYEPR